MIDRSEIDEKAKDLGVTRPTVEKDYVHGWLLACLFEQSPLGKKLVLKGSSCLRKGYLQGARYPDDLDFLSPQPISNETLGRELNALCNAVQERTGIVFRTDLTKVDPPKHITGQRVLSRARVYFKDFAGRDVEQKLKVLFEFTQFDRLYLPVQDRELIHPYSDNAACAARIRCVKLEELLATKMRCLLQREHVPDLFDLAYGSVLSGGPKVDLGQILSTFLRITIFGSNPRLAKGLLLDLPLDMAGQLWDDEVVCPKPSRVSFDSAKQALFSLVDELIRGQPVRGRSDDFFPSFLRNPILSAGRALTLLRIRYGGVTRLVEPYSLVFRILKDGIAREYLHVYDYTQSSSGRGPKRFLPAEQTGRRTPQSDFNRVTRWRSARRAALR